MAFIDPTSDLRSLAFLECPPMNDDIRLVRLEPRQMAQITIVVRCGGTRKLRLSLAMALMRIAGRLGGFKQVKLVRETR
jgi:hypothetical protein